MWGIFHATPLTEVEVNAVVLEAVEQVCYIQGFSTDRA